MLEHLSFDWDGSSVDVTQVIINDVKVVGSKVQLHLLIIRELLQQLVVPTQLRHIQAFIRREWRKGLVSSETQVDRFPDLRDSLRRDVSASLRKLRDLDQFTDLAGCVT